MPCWMRTACVSLLLTLGAPCALAQDGTDQNAPADDAPLEWELDPTLQAARAERLRRVTWDMIEASKGNLSHIRRGNFSQEALDDGMFDEVLSRFTQIDAQTGGLEFVAIRKIDDYTMQAWLLLPANNQMYDLVVWLERSPPFGIDGMTMGESQGVPDNLVAGWDEVGPLLDELDFQAGMAVYELTDDGGLAPIFLQNEDAPVNVNTMAHLWVLGLLNDSIIAGDATWSDTYPVNDLLKCPAPGTVYRTPPRTELTLREYVAFMLDKGECSAINHLITVLGQERVTRYFRESLGVDVGENVREVDPFLKFHEAYALKCSPRNDLLREYAAADPAERWRMLEEDVNWFLMDEALFVSWRAPNHVDSVGWFASPKQICEQVARLWAMTQSRPDLFSDQIGLMRGPARIDVADVWDVAWVREGQEPGAQSKAWLFRGNDGRVFVMAAAFMDPQRDIVDDLRQNDAVFGALELLETEGVRVDD